MARERKVTREKLYETTKTLLLQHGYNGFNFTLLAKQLNISRAALYKHFKNKEELVTDFMIFEMNKFLAAIRKIENYTNFDAQFDYLFATMFQHKEIHEILGMTYLIYSKSNKKVKANIEKLKNLHEDMYRYLQKFIKLGKKENRVAPHISDEALLGFIFQSFSIPNHFHIPPSEWYAQIKELVSHGMLTNMS